MYCRKCGRDIGEYPYCPSCGTSAREEAHTDSFAHKAKAEDKSFTDRVKDTFHHMTGGGARDVSFRLSDLWCDVLKKHTKQDGERLLISGTSTTTPTLADAARNWEKPWLYARIFAVLAITFVLQLLCLKVFSNTLVLPGLSFIGSMAIPFSLLILFWETNIPRNISIFDLVKMFFVGGMASLVFSLAFFSFIDPGQLDYKGATIVGIGEEIGKLVAVAIFIRSTKCRYLLNGMLIGAAVGTGFSVFESAGYAMMKNSTIEQMLDNIYIRGLLSFGGHVVWAAMAGAAIMLAMQHEEFSMRVFKRKQFWWLFPVPIVLHAVWDMPFSGIPVYLLLIVIAWIFILALIRSGMSEIDYLQKKETAASEESASA